MQPSHRILAGSSLLTSILLDNAYVELADWWCVVRLRWANRREHGEDWANDTCYPITAPHWKKRGRYLRRELPPLTLTLCRSIWPTTDPSDPTVRKIVTVCMYDERNDTSMSPNSCYLGGGRAAKLRGCLHLLSGANYVFDIVDRERKPPSFTE